MVRRKKQSIYSHKQQEWADLYNQGLSFREIGKREDVFYRTVQNVIKDVVDIRPKQKYQDVAEEWVRLYNEGLSANEIGEQYQVSVGVVTRYLKDLGVELRYSRQRERQYDQYVEEWVKLYEEGKSLREIADMYGLTASHVHNYIKDKTTMRWYSETSRVHSLNEQYFEVIDSDEKAYWLGFFYSSGSMIRGTATYAVQLTVGHKDKDRLEQFKRVIESEQPIETKIIQTESGAGEQYHFRLHSKALFESFCQLGFDKEKYDTLTFPKFLDPSFYPSFLRGYYEGKGGCHFKKTVYKNRINTNLNIRLYGNETFLKQIHRIFQEHIGVTLRYVQKKQVIKTTNPHHISTTQYLETGKQREIEMISNWLYHEARECSPTRDIREILKTLKEIKEQEKVRNERKKIGKE